MIDRIKKSLTEIIIITFTILGIVGYSITSSDPPIRVLFKTKGGNVIFDHEAHSSTDEYNIKCDSCHHETDSDEKTMNCRQCHRAGSEDYDSICDDRSIHKQCIGANCIDCHKDEGIDVGDCKICHD